MVTCLHHHSLAVFVLREQQIKLGVDNTKNDHILLLWTFLLAPEPIINPLTRGEAQSARANCKDSYLRNEYCYSNEGEDNGVLIILVPIKLLPYGNHFFKTQF